jgi:transcriptional antiterminator
LVFKPNKGIQSVYQDFLLRSKAYDLFQLIYTNENYSTEELAQLLFVSTSTLRRLIKKAREYLKKEYDISIHVNPYHFVGDERNIRYFGYQLYTEGYSFTEWPIDKVNSVELEFFISSLIRKMQIKLPYTSVQRLKTVLAVNTIRLANGHCVRGLRLNKRMQKDIEEVFSSISF